MGLPFYDFECKDCGHRFTLMISWKEKDTATCPGCGSGNLRQLVTSFCVRGGASSGSSPGPARSTGFG